MENNRVSFRGDVLLAFQVALLGMIIPSLRGVTVGWEKNTIEAICLYDKEIGDNEAEISSDIEAELIASFPEYHIHVTTERYDAPEILHVRTLKAWVYMRKE